MKSKSASRLPLIAFSLCIGSGPAAMADTYYWDLNQGTANTVVAATGAWNGTNVFWNTNSTGGAGTTTATVGNADDLVLFSGTTYTTGTITASGTRAASSITFEDNVALTLAGAVTIGGTGTKDGIFVASGNNANNIVSGTITLNGNNTIQKDGTGTLTLSAAAALAGSGNLEFKNNNTGAISLTSTTAGAFNFTGSITNSGTGSGGVNIGASTGNDLIGPSVTSITQNSTTSDLTIFGGNTFSGGVIVKAGIANIVNSGASAGASGSITLGDIGGSAAASIFMGSGATNATPITVQPGSSGVKTIGSIYAAGGTGTTMTWSGNIIANDDVTVFANGNPSVGLVLSGSSISIAAGKTMTLNNAQGTASKLNISGSLSGTSTSQIVLTTGGATLSGNNSSFAGTITQQSASPLNITHSNALGTNKLYLKSTSTGTGATLGLSGGIAVATPIEMDSTTGRENIVSTGTGNNSLTGGITITGAGGNALAIFNNQTSGNLTISGGISGASFTGSISLRGTQAGAKGFLNGAVTIASDLQNNNSTDWTINAVGSSYNGTRIMNSGSILLGANNGLATNAQVYWSSGATGKLDMNGFNQSVVGLNSSNVAALGAVTNNGATDSTLTLANAVVDYTFSGVISDGTTNKTSLEMSSTGRKQTLSGTNTYTGDTTVSAGVLAVNGTLANTTTTVTGGTLQGSGSIGGPVTINNGGTLAPGNLIESLGTGALTLANGSIYAYEMANNSTTGADLTFVTGDLNIGLITLTLTDTGTWALDDTITLFSYTGALTGGIGQFDGTTRGFTVASNVLADGETFTNAGQAWIIDYNDGGEGTNYISDSSGTFVTLTAVPEPNVAALIGGFAVLALLRRRR